MVRGYRHATRLILLLPLRCAAVAFYAIMHGMIVAAAAEPAQKRLQSFSRVQPLPASWSTVRAHAGNKRRYHVAMRMSPHALCTV